MPNHLSNYSERGPHEDINQLVDTMSPAKKRKRSTADHSQTETTYKRTSMKGNHMNGTAEAFNESSNDFSHPLGHTHEASNTAAAALAAQLHVPEASFISTGTTGENDRPLDNSFDNTQGSPFSLSAPYPPTAGTAAQVQAARDASNSAQGRPQVGSEEWNRIRRDNHKEGNSKAAL